jgi:hypothetical protein
MDIWIHGVLMSHMVASPCLHISTGATTATTATYLYTPKTQIGAHVASVEWLPFRFHHRDRSWLHYR